MERPPFTSRPLAEALAPSHAPLPAPARQATAPVPGALADRPARRHRLAELNVQMHCSIIGTCLGTHELRRLIARLTGSQAQDASELEVHHQAVELAGDRGAGSKALDKLLDERHAAALQRFRHAAGEAELSRLWQEAVQGGEIPGAYWAVMTHPRTTVALQAQAFGDVHMLSHLVGSANRADIRRLVALERENGELKHKLERQQARLQEMSIERQETVRHLSRQMAELMSQVRKDGSAPMALQANELAILRQSVRTKDQQIALHTSRRERAEHAAATQAAQVQRLRENFNSATALVQELQAELAALEASLAATRGGPQGGEGRLTESGAARQRHDGVLAAHAGRRILYVGGRPGSTAAIRDLCEREGIVLSVHDGGIEDRKGLLEAAVPGVDLVMFPVDCIDHDSMGRLKRLCLRHGIRYEPLRSAGIGSFLAGLQGRAIHVPVIIGTSPAHHCLGHG